MSLAWWIYLLAAGILLIAIGAMNEMKKQNVGKNIAKADKIYVGLTW